MKKALYLLLTLVIVAASCQKSQPLPQAIQGKWHLYKTAIVENDERDESDSDQYYEFSDSKVTITDKYGKNVLDYSLDEANKTLKIGNIEYIIDSFKPGEMVLRSEGIIFTVIDGVLVKTVQVYYHYLRKE